MLKRLEILSAVAVCASLLVLATACSRNNPTEDVSNLELLLSRKLSVGTTLDGSMVRPLRLTLARHQKNFLYVTDNYRSMVFEFRIHGNQVVPMREFSVPGAPSGIACGGNLLYIGDNIHGSVGVYRTNGTWLFDMGTGRGEFTTPNGIAIDEESRLVFVLDSGEHVVKIFAMDGSYQGIITGGSNGLETPTALTIDPQRREVLVSDYGSLGSTAHPPQIKIFSYEGDPIQVISGKQGMFGSRFSRPQGLAVTPSGNILMVDCFACEIMLFDRETGSLLGTIGEAGEAPGQLLLPMDIVLADGSIIFVSNNTQGTIESFPLGDLQ